MESKPCGPTKISLIKLKIPTHTSGEMSTPATGGTTLRVTLSTGSVGFATRLHGSTVRSYLGNQESATRKRKSTVPIVRTLPSATFVGPTHHTAEAACAAAGAVATSSGFTAACSESPLTRAGATWAI